MDKIDDTQPLVRRGFNFDTLTRYTGKFLRSPLASYIAILLLSRKSAKLAAKNKFAASAALWAVTNLILPSVGKIVKSIFGMGDRPVYWPSQVVVVTGGSSGIGLQLVMRLLKAGAKVAILDVHPFPIDDERYSAKWEHYNCDITNLEQVKETAEKIRADFGNPTMLVNNAGIVCGKLLLDMTDNEVDKVIDVNLTAHFHLIRQFLPAMIKAKSGHIVTIGSIVSFAGTPQATTYCATKGGVKLLHESLRCEVMSRYGSNNIQFTIAYPGVTSTGLFDGLNLGQFFMPTLEPPAIAREIFSALSSGRGRDIYLPKFARIVGYLYIVPPGLRSWLVNLITNGDTAMSTFKGHVKYE